MKISYIKYLLLFLVIGILFYLGHNYLNEKKTKYYSSGGFKRTFLPNASALQMNIPIPFNAYYFLPTTNQKVAFAIGEKYIYRIQHILGKNDHFLLDTIPNLRIMANQNFFADNSSQIIFIQNNLNDYIAPLKLENNAAGNIVTKTQDKIALSKDQYPVLFKDGKMICYQKTTSAWNFRYAGQKIDQKNEFNKLTQQGKISYVKDLNKYVFVPLFANKIILYDSLFNVTNYGKTIDTVSKFPTAKQLGNSYQFDSPPRPTNNDFVILNKHLLVWSYVSSDDNVSLRENVVFDVYDLSNNLKYKGSISIKNENDELPKSIHLLENNTLLLLYEQHITTYTLKI